MDVSTLKAKIKSKQLPSYLIFAGEEWKVQEIYIKQIAKVTGKETVRIDSVTEIYRRLKNKTFAGKTKIYIVRDDKELMKNEKLQQQIEASLVNDILIHILTTVDKRTKYYKRYNASIINFTRLSDAMLYKYIQKEIKLSKANTERLADICEHDYGRILLEIDKIKRYIWEIENTQEGKSRFDLVFEQLVKDGTIYEPPYDAIFDLVDAILDRKVNRAFDLLEQSYAVGEATMVMLSVLYNNSKAVLQVQTYKGDNLSKATGLSGFSIKLAKKHIGKYSEKELNYILHLIQKIESGIKTGRMEDEFAMQYLLTHIM